MLLQVTAYKDKLLSSVGWHLDIITLKMGEAGAEIAMDVDGVESLDTLVKTRLRKGLLHSGRLGSFLANGWPQERVKENGVVCTAQEVSSWDNIVYILHLIFCVFILNIKLIVRYYDIVICCSWLSLVLNTYPMVRHSVSYAGKLFPILNLLQIHGEIFV